MRTALALATCGIAASASADPIRLRADAFATTASPVGLLALDASGTEDRVSAEAAVWMGGGAVPGDDAGGDVLVIALHARDRSNRALATVGRFVATLGALRPTHADGASVRLRLPRRFDVEGFAGLPVRPRLGVHAWDWVAGGRVARRIGDYGSAGIALLEQRDEGRLAIEELGADAGFAIDARNDVSARAAYDLANPGLAEASFALAHRHGKTWSLDLHGGYRAASHLVPATSLFSVLGDVPSLRAGATATWRAAPRLDVDGELGVRRSEESTSPIATVRAKLRLGDTTARVASLELRRDVAWTGARGALRCALPHRLTVASELELVFADAGHVWPWGLVALATDRGAWTAAIAIEASASPSDRYRLDALAQLGRRWGAP